MPRADFSEAPCFEVAPTDYTFMAAGVQITIEDYEVSDTISADGSGIGFTMSLSFATLALPEALVDHARMGVLNGSAISAVLGGAIPAVEKKRAVPGRDRLAGHS